MKYKETTSLQKSDRERCDPENVQKKMSINELLEKLRKGSREDEANETVCGTKNFEGEISIDEVAWSSSDNELQPIPVFVKTPKGSLIQLHVSMEDSVQVIIQSLSEAAETCYVTCYWLEMNGKRINDYVYLSEIPNLCPHSTLEMVEGTYDERSARGHVKRLRDLLSRPQVDCPNSCLLPYFSVERNQVQANDETCHLPLIDTSLGAFYPTVEDPVDCIQGICFSGWNPPPGNRRLLGDLFYLEVKTLEDICVHITATATGFFVNEIEKDTFNPQPSTKYPLCHALVDLLEHVSPLFKKNLQTLLHGRYEKDPFELYPSPLPVRPWLGQVKTHTRDLNRAEELFIAKGSETQFRDWNEEFQAAKELQKSTIRERIIRDHAIVKINKEFVEAATEGACAIINKMVAPLNPMDPKEVQMYIYNNIFFSYATDTEDKYEEVEGRYTYASANNDLKGVMSYSDCFVEGLYTLATAIIDYRGFRMVAQSMIPGIFNPSTVVYNSSDFEKEGEFNKLLAKAGMLLHIPPHEITTKTGEKHTIYCSQPTKGIIGTDGRRYIIDLCRVTAQDANFKGSKMVMAILRPELIHILNESSFGGEDEVLLNPDVFVGDNVGSHDEELVENASSFLVEALIHNMIQEFSSFVCVPVDGQTLTTLMHHRGINMRYLGYIALASSSWPFIQELCIKEMIVRAAKYIFRGTLCETSSSMFAPAIAYFLSCLLGSPRKRLQNKKKKKKKPLHGPAFQFTSESLWNRIKQVVYTRFQYNLSETTPQAMREKAIPVLRDFCQKTGVQVAAKAYNFSLEQPFQPEDVLDLLPVVKHCNPKTADGHELLEAGVSHLAQNKLEIAFELLSEALVIFSQVYGPIHQATAICFSNMAMVLYQSGDPAEASIYQRRAVIINERVQGASHHETAQSYGNLALFYHKMGKINLALQYIQRALYLGYLTCGTSHPDNATSFTNIGMILQDLGDVRTSLTYFMKALALNESSSSSEHLLLTAAICHAIAVNYSLMGSFKEALDYERRNYSLLLKSIGDEKDPRIEDSSMLLKQYTSKAVELQKKQQKVKK